MAQETQPPVFLSLGFLYIVGQSRLVLVTNHKMTYGARRTCPRNRFSNTTRMPDEVPGLWTYTAVVWRSCGKHPVAFCIISVYLISFLPSRFCRCHRRERLKPDTPVRLGDQLGIFKGMMSNEAGCSLDIQPLQVSNKTPLLV